MTELSATRLFFGRLLIVVGGLIAGLCGLCTGGFQVFLFIDYQRGSPAPWGILFLPVVVCTMPIVIGLGLYYAGRQLVRTDKVQ